MTTNELAMLIKIILTLFFILIGSIPGIITFVRTMLLIRFKKLEEKPFGVMAVVNLTSAWVISAVNFLAMLMFSLAPTTSTIFITMSIIFGYGVVLIGSPITYLGDNYCFYSGKILSMSEVKQIYVDQSRGCSLAIATQKKVYHTPLSKTYVNEVGGYIDYLINR